MVEILKDVSFRVIPVSSGGARKMIEETKSFPILNGSRGKPPLDKKAIARLIHLCSEIVVAYPRIAEIDLNPVIVHQQGLSIVDARVILKKDEKCRLSEKRCERNGDEGRRTED
jgi:acetyltransferase